MHFRLRYLLNKSLVAAVLVLAAGATSAQPYRDADLPVADRVQDLLARMTLKEKAWQLFMLAGSLGDGVQRYQGGAFGFQLGRTCADEDPAACANDIQRYFVEQTRLGIPVILFDEALHGLTQPGATSFPQAIGLAATFDTDLMREVADAIADECRARGVRQVLSPVVNIADDVRWGRTEETYGEDPYLVSEMGVAFVAGFTRQGILTTPKHFIANVGAGGRDSYPIQASERRIRDHDLPPFVACIERGGSRSIMTSYNSLDGLPCTANGWLNNQVLKQELGFDGFVISDAGAVGGANVLHFTAGDYPDAAAQALAGGLDVIFQTCFDHFDLFWPAFRDGRIPQDVLDDAVTRVLRAKFDLGLFEHPYIEARHMISAAQMNQHRQLARRAAQEAVVLLKNDANTLPLRRDLRQVAVLGPDAAEARLGGYSGPGNDVVSVLDGLRRRLEPSTRVVHAQGCPRLDTAYATIPSDALSCTRDGARQPGLLGEYYDNIQLAGDPVLTRVDPQLGFQWTLFSPDPERLPGDFYSVRWTGRLTAPVTGRFAIGIEGNDGYRLYIDDELVIDNWRKRTFGHQLVDYDFTGDRTYDLRVEFFESAGNGRIRLVWNHGIATDGAAALDSAVDLAARSDVAVIVAGSEEGEFRDRADLRLPGRQEDLIRRVAGTGTPTVVVLIGGSAIVVSDWLDQVPAVLQAWYPGEAGGEALADILLGEVNPAGRLPISVPVAVGQLPLVYNHLPTGRGDDYLDLTGQPQFPFGYGLSYTQFTYGDLRLVEPQITVGDTAVARFTVSNTGPVAGDEVVQLYIRDELASVARPVLELEGFQRIHLEPGETRELHFAVTPRMLSMLDRNLLSIVEPGEFRILIGASCRDIRLRGLLTVVPRRLFLAPNRP